MTSNPIVLNRRPLHPHKAVVEPLFGTPNVLTKEPWSFVSLWLRRQGKNDALFYWEQASSFAKASEGLTPQSAPLLHYYSFMNATKALLTAKGKAFQPFHGVREYKRDRTKGDDIDNVGIEITTGMEVLPALSTYYSEPDTTKTYTLQELFFNLPF